MPRIERPELHKALAINIGEEQLYRRLSGHKNDCVKLDTIEFQPLQFDVSGIVPDLGFRLMRGLAVCCLMCRSC